MESFRSFSPRPGDHAAYGFHNKHQRLARKALYDLAIFHEAVENEMHCMLANVDEGLPLDSELFQRMMIVKSKYAEAMHGLRHQGDGRERHALISLADAVQDLMVYIHQRHRSH